MPPIHRRGFLKAALAATAPLGFAGVARAIDPIGRTRPSHLKLSIAAYSYRDSLPRGDKKGKMDLFGFCDLAADMGLDAVELTSYYFPPDVDARLPPPAQAARLQPRPGRLGHLRRQQLLRAPRPQARRATEARPDLGRQRGRAGRPRHPDLRRHEGEGRHRGRRRRAGDRVHQAVAALRDREGRDPGPGEPRRDHGDARAVAPAGQGGRFAQLRRQPRHRQLPHGRPVRRPRQDRPVRGERPGEDRDPRRRQAQARGRPLPRDRHPPRRQVFGLRRPRIRGQGRPVHRHPAAHQDAAFAHG